MPLEDQNTPVDKNFEQLFASTPVPAEESAPTIEVHPAPAETSPSWQVEDVSSLKQGAQPAAENIEGAAEIPGWLKEFKPEEKAESEEDLPTWLKDIQPAVSDVAQIQAAPVETLPSLLNENQQSPTGQMTTEPSAPSQPQPEPSVPAATPTDDNQLPGWLSELVPPQTGEEAVIPPEDRPSTILAWVQEAQDEKPLNAAAEITTQEEPLSAGELPDWLKSLEPEGVESSQPEEVIPTTAPDITPEPADALPEWLKDIQTGSAEVEAASPTFAIQGETEPIPTEAEVMPDAGLPTWLSQEETPAPSAQAEVPPQAESPEVVKQTGSLDLWLRNFEDVPLSEIPTQPIAVKSAVQGETTQGDTTPTFEKAPEITPVEETALDQEPVEDNLPEWLKGLSSADTEETTAPLIAEEPLPEWLTELESSTPPVTQTSEPLPMVDAASPIPDWIKDEVETPVELSAPTPVPTIASEAPAVTSSPTLDEQDAALAWLESLAAKHGADEQTLFVKPEERQETPPAWVQEAAQTASGETVSQAAETPAIEVITPEAVAQEPAQIAEPLVAITPEESTPPIETTVAAPDTLGEPAGEAPLSQPEAIPDWLQELKASPTIETPVETSLAPEPTQPKNEEDAALAWLEGLAAKHGADEATLFVKPEDRQETPPTWVQESTAQAPEEPVVETHELVGTEPVLETGAIPTAAVEIPAVPAAPAVQETSEEDAALAWLESLAAKHGADEATLFVKPEARTDTPPTWVQEAALQNDQGATPPEETPSLVEVKAETESAQTIIAKEPAPAVETSPVIEAAPVAEASVAEADTSLPDWLRGFENEETEAPTQPVQLVSTPPESEIKQEPSLQPVEETSTWLTSLAKAEAEEAGVPTVVEPVVDKVPGVIHPSDETVVVKRQDLPSEIVAPKAEASLPEVTEQPANALAPKSILAQAQASLDEGRVTAALQSYSQLIISGELIDEAIHDLRDALYHYPVEVTIWQTLGDAYVRTNRLQDALDAYTKAEELLR